MNYGRAIKILRAARNVSQRDLAIKAELDPSYVSLIEGNQRKPGQDTLNKITKALHVPFYLFIFLASEKDDLAGVSEEQAEDLGKAMLKLLVDFEGETGNAR